jgi:Copper transport outer membrane protein, MctB
MFDLRYHVASLAAVFIALVIGILVGVGLSGRGVLRETERINFEVRIDQLERSLAEAEERVQSQDGLEAYERETYPVLMENRLAGRRVAALFVGSFEGELAESVQQTIDDGGGSLSLRALQVPIQTGELLREASGVEDAPRTVEELGRALAAELVADSGEKPLWDEVGPLLVQERDGDGEVDAVIVARTAEPQDGQTARFLAGFYSGLAAADVPVVGVETSDAEPSTIRTYRDHGFSTVDNVDTLTGRLALALVLEGATGAYGIKDDADDVLPPVTPVQTTTG